MSSGPGRPDEVGGEPGRPDELGGEPGRPDELGGEPGTPDEVGGEPGTPDEVEAEPAGRRPADPARQANLLGTVSLAVADRVRDAAELGAGHGGSLPAALVSLAGYLDGQPIESLRSPLGLSHSAAVRVVDRLVEAGLARRREGADRRSVAVELTPAGHAAAAAVVAARGQALQHALAELEPGERVELTRLHEKILATLTEGRVSAGRTCRLCDIDACGHWEGRCPVTRAADAAEAARPA